MSTSQKIYKVVVLIGDSGVGKSAFIKRFNCGEFEKKHVATIGVDVHPINIDGVRFNVWDCAGLEKFMGLAHGYYLKADCAIIMIDDRDFTLENVTKWTNEFRRVEANAPIEIVNNKCEIKSREGMLNISIKDNKNIDEVFRNLISKLN